LPSQAGLIPLVKRRHRFQHFLPAPSLFFCPWRRASSFLARIPPQSKSSHRSFFFFLYDCVMPDFFRALILALFPPKNPWTTPGEFLRSFVMNFLPPSTYLSLPPLPRFLGTFAIRAVQRFEVSSPSALYCRIFSRSGTRILRDFVAPSFTRNFFW